MIKIIPSHIAVIMDGNARWAKLNKLPKKNGYEKGIETLKSLIKLCIKQKIKILTVYALSTENTHRKDIKGLYLLIREFIKKNKSLREFKDIDFYLLGDKKNISKEFLQFFTKLEQNKNNKKIIFNLAFNYGSWNEIENCINNILQNYQNNEFKEVKIDEKIIRNNLYTKKLPDPDILIRTGGQKRLSNFLLLQLKYTEIFFIDALWPDFNEKYFLKILREYKNRKRSYGL